MGRFGVLSAGTFSFRGEYNSAIWGLTLVDTFIVYRSNAFFLSGFS